MNEYDLSEELRSLKKVFLYLIEEVKKDSSLVKHSSSHLKPLKLLGNTNLELYADAAADELEPNQFFFIKKYPSVKKYCSVLSNLIIQIDKEIDYEEKISVIAEKLSQVHVSLLNGKTDPELEWKIRENAGKIARIIS